MAQPIIISVILFISIMNYFNITQRAQREEHREPQRKEINLCGPL
jgi:hypothetical protein